MKTNSLIYKGKGLVLLGLLILMLFHAGCRKNEGENGPLAIVGTGACEEVLNKLSEAFNRANPDYQVTVPKSIGSGRGIEVVGNGEYVLGRIARSLKEKDAQYGLSYKPFAKDAVIFAVGDKVGIRDITGAKLADIYSGKTTNWSELGGSDGPIRALAREEGDSSRTVIEDNIAVFKNLAFSDRVKYVYHDYEMVELLVKYPTSIGCLTWSNLGEGMHPVAIDGNEPILENISSGQYPLVCEYAFVYHDKRLNATARKFIEFVFSEEGGRILELNGLLPVGGK